MDGRTIRIKNTCFDYIKHCLGKLSEFRREVIISSYKLIYGVLHVTGWRKKSEGSGKCTVILMNYKRPFNMECQLRLVLCCNFVGEVILSNNNPGCNLLQYIRISDHRLKVINQPTQRYPSVRFELARTAKFPMIIAIDDDVFPTPGQLKILFHGLLADPRRPHGWGGEIFKTNLTDIDNTGNEPVNRGVTNLNMDVDALIWAFAFSKTVNERYFQLLDKIEESNESVTSSEDVVLSFSGDKPSRIHASGQIICCPTCDDENIATYRQAGFLRRRVQLVNKCRKVTGISIKY